MREFGAPDLTDADWLYGSSREAITAQIVNPKMGQMPTWQGRLDKATIDALAVYVHSLGGANSADPPQGKQALKPIFPVGACCLK